MDSVTRAIWRKFRIKRGDTIPFVGWARGGRFLLAELLGELGFDHGAEVGVQLGQYSEVLCQKNPKLKLICVDPWHSYKALPEGTAMGYYEQAMARLAPYGVTVMRERSMDAVVKVPDGFLDFVYIDGLHEFDPVMLDLVHWSRKVKPGGIVAGHDFCNYYKGGVVDAVYAYTRAHGINSWYSTREREPSFFWVNPVPEERYW